MAPAVPATMDRPHFIGIGGAGMSGIAKILAQRGAAVAGSDAKESATAEALRALGATVHIGHAALATSPRTPPAWSSPAPSAPTTPSWPRPPGAASPSSTARTRWPA
ncbi:hypothetical protein GCM10020000_17820 [Streptomyces olivoverticillatus]